MPLYKPNSNPAALAQSAMSGATQAAASQTKQTTVNVKKESNFWDDLYKGAAALNMGARAVGGVVNAVEDAKSLYDAHKVRSAYDDVAKAYEQGGLESIQNNPDMQDYWHNKAINQFMADRLSTEKGRLETKQNIQKFAAMLYQDFRVGALRLNEAYNKGDMQGFASEMERLTASQPTPHRLKNLGDGTFAVYFRSDRDGDFVDTGERMSAKQALELVNKHYRGETYVMSGVDMKLTPMNREYELAVGKSALATVEGNAQNGANPSKDIILYDRRTGRIGGWAVVQNAVRDPTTGLSGYGHKPIYLVYGMDGEFLGKHEGLDGLARGTNFTHLNPGKTKGGAGNGVNSKAYGLIKDLTTVVDPATGEKSIDVEMAAALERGVALGHTPYQYADKLKRDVAVYASDIARNNPQLKPEEVRQRARAKAFAGGGDPQGLRKHGPPAPVRTAPVHASNAAPSKADARIKKAAAGEKPGGLQNLGGEQQVPWYQEAGWGPRKLSDAWQGLKDSFDSKKRGNEIPPGY